MSTLLLRLAAPMQSYGGESKYDIRMTETEPTKSAVVGLLSAALGRSRDASIEDLAALRFGVRVDQEGILVRDLHTAKQAKASYLTVRHYLSDAIFLAGVESEDDAFLYKLDEALHHPVFPLFLGRRSCPPSLPLALGVRTCTLEEALKAEPWLAPAWRQGRLNASLRLVLDANDMSHGRKRDYPVSFSSECRQMTYRGVQNGGYVDKGHDPMAELGGEPCI
ncbi:MAG: type I-E CRISPR-associated protein Cas5/CasD [Clostridia bacterium]|nr:type I-E CRISPR-associated protein Cas5/CasD [Clostridia bacterium]